MRYRYSRWDGSQDPFGPDVDASDVLEELADDVLMGTGADNALRRLMRRGMQGRFSGLDALRRRLNHMRQQEEEALDLRGPLEEVREQLDEILDRERSTLSFKAEDDARMREMFLDSLPPDAPGMIRELSDYRFVDPQAQQMFDQLMEHLREQVLGAYFRSMAEGMKSITPEQLAHFRDMLAELNQMIEQRARGDEYDFDGFMERYGDLFPDNPKSLDELLENMARRMAAMSRLMASLSAEQRAELQGLADQVMQDMDLAFEMSRLGSNLQGEFPNMPWGNRRWAAARATSRCRCRPRSTPWSACTTTRTSIARCVGTIPVRPSTTSTRRLCSGSSANRPSAISAGSRRSSEPWRRRAW